MKRIFVPAILILGVLACGLFVPATPTPPKLIEATVPVQVEAPAVTETPIPPTAAPPTPTLEPTLTQTAVPTSVVVPQQWNGIYTYPTGQTQHISLLIEKVKDNTFTGKMIWVAFGNSRGAILKTKGEFVTDFGDQTEQAKWNELTDYQDGIKTGTWLKWTETEIIEGRNYTVNGWYYAHIREDGKMVAVYFFSKDAITPDAGTFVLEKIGG